MIFVPRSQIWPDQLPTSSTGTPRPLLDPDRPYLTVHYTGAGLWLDPDDTPTELRAIQNYAQAAGKPWEYNYVIDGQGLVFEYAGGYRAAHWADHRTTPPTGMNQYAIGVLLLVGLADAAHLQGFEKPTDEMVQAFRELRARLTATGALAVDHQVLPHRLMPGANTLCPGPEVIKRWAELTATLQEDDNMQIRLMILDDSDAQFLAQMTNDGRALIILWADGSDKTQKAVAAHRKAALAHQAAFELPGQTIAGLLNCRLIGRLPFGDSQHTWTGDEVLDFDRPAGGVVDQNARDAVAIVSADLAGVDAQVDKIRAGLIAAGS